ncbi:MAG TPA: UvrD-helicase domain-containing protein, partial [Candidatus Thalassarchaeaceae archaeon]|nr:UvrD-helicase domain-containing protein [Candidatus Thalassarchaeaceae archaeon]
MTEVKKPKFKHNTAQRLALNIDSHIAVDAGAGTGKTRTIIDRVIEHYLTKDQRATRLLPQPNRPGRIPGGLLLSPESERTNLQNWEGMLPSEVVLLTFTRKAAEEMRNRLRERIAEKRHGSMLGAEDPNHDPRIPDHGFPEQLLMLLEDAPIGTIDSFLNQLIGPYRSLLGASLGQNVVTEAERLRLIQQGINTLWRLPSGSNANGPAVDAG